MNSIHPTAIITGDVTMGTGNTIGPHVVISGPATIGSDNWIGTGVVIGAPPEIRSFVHPTETAGTSPGEGVVIGDRNVIREYVQVHQGWRSATLIGSRTFIMNQSYIAHDCRIGDDATLASSVLLAGHTTIAESANIGLGASVHQRTFVGSGAMVGMGAVVTRDVPPFGKAFGNPARLHGVNEVGMERSGISGDAIEAVRVAYSAGPPAREDLDRLASLPELERAIGRWISRGDA
jgi:UDP-N-acetylglucosamine acyltransferase